MKVNFCFDNLFKYFYIERGIPITWLDQLANQTHQHYNNSNKFNIGGPSGPSKYITALYFTFSKFLLKFFKNFLFYKINS